MFTGWILDNILTATILDTYAQKLCVDIPRVIHRKMEIFVHFWGFQADLSTFLIFATRLTAFLSVLTRF